MAEAINDTQIVLFESSDGTIALDVSTDMETVWLNQDQMALLFDTTKQNVSRHIGNCFKEGELDKNSVVKESLTTATDGKDYRVKYYDLDVIISVGYRVKSQRGVEFRRWATDVLRRYIIEGRAENERRLKQLSQTIALIERVSDELDTNQVLEVVKSYASALDLLDDYDHQRVEKPTGTSSVYILEYSECMELIRALRFNDESSLFGIEKDDSFKSSIATIYQSFGGQDLYPSVQEKAANLLYFIVKNHSFHDGNKRIAATVFLYFLEKNGLLYKDDQKVVSDSALVATTIMIAESKPAEKEIMVSLVMNFLV
ncbi:virulence protein RhuM/Fic/DOC family protein [Adlercreutzia agrestimuris]|uniref:virulence protein RhuM/Fic/DOC family protein n=1 Tax=Adlercreutzia agrestimuris TaxID=2941324 RepID=UPI00203F8B6C|nr:virulence protein RhuM/Fic/DOC family protein [Adlercreutzia agrestimuris]